MTIAVLLLTCDRLDLTRATLESFARQNPDARERFMLLYADDASTDPAALQALTAAHGFETVVAHPTRRGVRALRAAGVAVAARRKADWVLVLENDWEWARPFPWATFTRLVAEHPEVYHLRLYGQYKERDRKNRCWTIHMGRGRSAVTWEAVRGLPEAVEVAHIHWGAPPALTRMAEATALCVAPSGTGYDGSGDVHEMHASGRLTAKVARVVENVVYHIGFTKTPGLGHVRPWAAKAPRPKGWSRPAPVPRHVGATELRRRTRPPLYTPAWQATRAKYQTGAARCLDLALARGPRPASLLDVGCGDGSLVLRAREFGVDAIGVDLTVPDHAAFRQADLRVPLDLGRTFDWVLCWEVAEHLPAEAADTLISLLARHLAPGGTLLFTAAHPGQGGDGHLNEQPAVYWRDKLTAAGLHPEPVETQQLAAAWTAEAKTTPWYGANLQVFRAPGVRVRVAPPLPRVAVTMRTADRSPHPNYVGGTVARLLAQGLAPADLHLCPTAPEVGWLDKELPTPLYRAVTLHTPAQRRTPNENGLAQIRCLDPTRYDWVLLLEDDLGFCADFLGSVQRWLLKANRPDRNVYRLFTFRNRPPTSRKVYAYDMPLKNMCGTQAVLLRMADALDFLEWGDKNLETWGGFRGNPRIAFDKLMAAWALARWPDRPGVVSHPMFVQHVGDVSSLHPAAIRMDSQFAGARWRFEGATA